MNVYGPRQDYHGAYIAVIMKMLDAIDRGDAQRLWVMAQKLLTYSSRGLCQSQCVQCRPIRS